MAHAQETLEEWLRREPFTLAMSSSFFGFLVRSRVCPLRRARN